MLWSGTQGMLYHFDGEEFVKINTGSIATIFGICGFAKGALLVGSIGTVLRYVRPVKTTPPAE